MGFLTVLLASLGLNTAVLGYGAGLSPGGGLAGRVGEPVLLPAGGADHQVGGNASCMKVNTKVMGTSIDLSLTWQSSPSARATAPTPLAATTGPGTPRGSAIWWGRTGWRWRWRIIFLGIISADNYVQYNCCLTYRSTIGNK